MDGRVKDCGSEKRVEESVRSGWTECTGGGEVVGYGLWSRWRASQSVAERSRA